MVAACSMRGMKINRYENVTAEPQGVVPSACMDRSLVILRNVLKK